MRIGTAWHGLAGLLLLVLLSAGGTGCDPDAPRGGATVAGAASAASRNPPPLTDWNMKDKVRKTEEEWSRELTPERFKVLRGHGTERAFTGELWDNHEAGVYRCAGCGLELFRSEAKFDSGTGWPSFHSPAKEGHVGTKTDNTLWMRRTEVHCARCEGHLGHVFDDGPKPTGLRYCINSVSLTFEKAR